VEPTGRLDPVFSQKIRTAVQSCIHNVIQCRITLGTPTDLGEVNVRGVGCKVSSDEAGRTFSPSFALVAPVWCGSRNAVLDLRAKHNNEMYNTVACQVSGGPVTHVHDFAPAGVRLECVVSHAVKASESLKLRLGNDTLLVLKKACFELFNVQSIF
jgi:hypothetical protein